MCTKVSSMLKKLGKKGSNFTQKIIKFMALTFTLNLFSKVNCIVAKEHVCACLCLCISMHVWE